MGERRPLPPDAADKSRVLDGPVYEIEIFASDGQQVAPPTWFHIKPLEQANFPRMLWWRGKLYSAHTIGFSKIALKEVSQLSDILEG